MNVMKQSKNRAERNRPTPSASHICRMPSSSPSPQALIFPLHARANQARGQKSLPARLPALSDTRDGARPITRWRSTHGNRTRKANDKGTGGGKQRQRRNDDHIATKETDPTSRFSSSQPRQAKRHGTRTKRDDTTPCGHENTITRRKHRPLHTPPARRIGRTERKAIRRTEPRATA